MEPLMPKQWKDYKKASSCHICFKPFKEGNRKVRDYCHYSGIYRGVAHSLCNLQCKIPSYIPIVFHNFSGYDAHLFIKGLARGAHMGVIAKNKEKLHNFSVNVEVDKYIDKDGKEHSKEIELRFIDSFKFMSSSLDSLDYIIFSVNVEVDKYIDKDGEESSKEIELRFIDRFKFMSSSLDSLINNLARGNNKFFGFEDYNES